MRKKPTFLAFSTGVVVAVWMAATACGDSDSPGTAASSQEKERDKAHTYYLERVHNAVGSCVNCHAGAKGPRIMAADAEESYLLLEKTVGLIAAPRTSPLIQYTHLDTTILMTPD